MYPNNSLKLLAWLKAENLFAKKSLSQNFLIDFEILEKIVKVSQINNNDVILEIGPGPGVLTKKLLDTKAHVISVEKDSRFAHKLIELFSKFKNFEIFENDILKIIDEIFKNHFPIKIVANIPYKITSSILEKLCNHSKKIQSVTLLVQKEVGERIVAKKGKISGSISRFVQFYYDAQIVQIVPNSSFFPKPKVDSCILVLKPKVTPTINEKFFFKFVQHSFCNRRKKLSSSLKKTYPIDQIRLAFDELNLNENIRAEELLLEDFLKLFKKLN
jgi:16S rRNA (adenine1518-N6/adenine1519-N6)-dimethyltransferase